MSMKILSTLPIVTLLLSALPAVARAQGDHASAPETFVNQLIEQATGMSLGSMPHDPQTTTVAAELNEGIGHQLATLPLPSSSGGFGYVLDRPTGAIVPASATFGPFLADRALTNGGERFTYGFTFQTAQYESFEGVDLASGDLRFYLEDDATLMDTTLVLNIETTTASFQGNYGVTDDIDIGVTLPIVRVQMDGTAIANIVRSESAKGFDGAGRMTQLSHQSTSATGIGDISLHAKYRLLSVDTTSLATVVDWRLPTGDADDLIGTGAHRFRVLAVGSGEYGRVSPHVNIGYTWSNNRESGDNLHIPDEFNYTFGVDVSVASNVAVGFDLAGRDLRGVERFGLGTRTFPPHGHMSPFDGQPELVLTDESGTMRVISGVLGGKVNLTRTLILNVGVLVPLSSDCLRQRVTPIIGVDYTL